MLDQEDPNERPSFDQLLLRMEIMMTKETTWIKKRMTNIAYLGPFEYSSIFEMEASFLL